MTQPSVWMTLPFAALLGAIAIGPLALPKWWEKRYPFVACGLGLVTVSYYLVFLRSAAPILSAASGYFSFIVLVGSLYVIAGGIHIRVKGRATPFANCVFLLLGALISNLIGTTGASMLLIRPWIRVNRYRVTGHHVVFFIFLVSNVGGCLTPIGDPPLFLGFIKGVPFWWVAIHCWLPWLLAIVALLGMFYWIDRRNYLRAPVHERESHYFAEEWKFTGLRNVPLLGAALASVFLPFGWREGGLCAAALASWFLTPREIHEANHFDLHPMLEVSWLFAGIFATMAPALQLLNRHAGALGLSSPMQFYWFTGTLSGILDSAPAYLAFLAAAHGLAGLDLEKQQDVARFIAASPRLLLSISISSVFFGALTYLGNGPNFMVRSIARRLHVETPGFLGYVWRYTVPYLLPVLLGICLLFFWR